MYHEVKYIIIIKVIQFCVDFVPVYINNGLALDGKLATSFINIIKLLIHETSDKI